ncbi:MAG: hypothetical protein WDO15_13370 [Bacteroidota bacterium]
MKRSPHKNSVVNDNGIYILLPLFIPVLLLNSFVKKLQWLHMIVLVLNSFNLLSICPMFFSVSFENRNRSPGKYRNLPPQFLPSGSPNKKDHK